MSHEIMGRKMAACNSYFCTMSLQIDGTIWTALRSDYEVSFFSGLLSCNHILELWLEMDVVEGKSRWYVFFCSLLAFVVDLRFFLHCNKGRKFYGWEWMFNHQPCLSVCNFASTICVYLFSVKKKHFRKW